MSGFRKCRPWNMEPREPKRCLACDYWDKCMKRSRAVVRGASGRR